MRAARRIDRDLALAERADLRGRGFGFRSGRFGSLAFLFQLAKNIGSEAAVLEGKVDQIIITGGIAYNSALMDRLTKKVEFIAPVTVYPGEDELLALAQGALRVMNGEEKAKIYE